MVTSLEDLASQLGALSGVATVKPWFDGGRVYITLRGTNRAYRSDAKTKIWAQGSTIHRESAKGYNSDEWSDSWCVFVAAAERAGFKVRIR